MADKHPEKLRQLVELWWVEAGKYNVLPLDERFAERQGAKGQEGKEKKSYTFYPGTVRIPKVVHLTLRTNRIASPQTYT